MTDCASLVSPSPFPPHLSRLLPPPVLPPHLVGALRDGQKIYDLEGEGGDVATMEVVRSDFTL